jgi:E3 ubiquitin-protein ligase SIAH1
VYEHIHWLDPYVLAAKVRCPNEAYGCRSSVSYCLVTDHCLVCPHAPCCCPEPGCIFLGSPQTLRDHLASHHKWVVTPITVGKCIVVGMQPAERRRLLAAEDGEHVFLLVASERGGGGERHVKVVRIRASAEEGTSWYRCKVWTHAPVDAETGCRDVLMLEAKVRSCGKPCEEAAMEVGGRCLHVPSDTPPEAGGILLRVRIDKLEVQAPVSMAD